MGIWPALLLIAYLYLGAIYPAADVVSRFFDEFVIKMAGNIPAVRWTRASRPAQNYSGNGPELDIYPHTHPGSKPLECPEGWVAIAVFKLTDV